MILVTGASGYIGRHVYERLVAESSQTVRVLLRDGETLKDPISTSDPIFFSGATTVDSLARDLAGFHTIIHLASKSIDLDGTGFQSNLDLAELLAGAAGKAGVKRFFYLSTAGVYGHRAHDLTDESAPLHPDTPHALSRVAVEQLLLQCHRRGDFHLLLLRHRFVIGAGDRFVVPGFIKLVKNTRFLPGGGIHPLSFVFVEDLAEIMARLAVAESIPMDDFPVYHMTDGYPTSAKEALAIVREEFSIKREFAFIPVPFPLAYYPVRIAEMISGTDPETSKRLLSSIRLRLLFQPNSFSNEKLVRLLGSFQFQNFRDAVRKSRNFYNDFL